MKEKKKLSLPAWIFIGMLAGIVAGLIFAFAGLGDFTTEWIKPVGTIYVNLLKFLVVPVVLFSIADGVISLKDLKRVGSVGVKTFIYYMITTALAVVIGLILVNIFKGNFTPLPSADLGALEYESKEAPSVMQVIVNIFPSNLLQPMVSSDMLPVIVIAIFLGAGVLAAGEKGQKIAELINCMEEVIMKIMMMIIKFTPIGVFCLMTNVVAVNGADIIGKLALIIGVAYLGYIVHVVVVYGLSVKFLSKMSPIKFFKGLAPAMITAFTTTSSNATLPVNIECCNKMGAEPEISSFVLPLGATINMDGTAIYQAVCAVFIACCYGVAADARRHGHDRPDCDARFRRYRRRLRRWHDHAGDGSDAGRPAGRGHRHHRGRRQDLRHGPHHAEHHRRRHLCPVHLPPRAREGRQKGCQGRKITTSPHTIPIQKPAARRAFALSMPSPMMGSLWYGADPKPPLPGEVARRSRDGEVAANLIQPLSQPAADSSPGRGAFLAAAG